MANINQSIAQLVGRTPLLELANYEKEHKLEAKLVVKLEYFNPNQSVKDRIALAMVEDAEKKRIIKARIYNRRNNQWKYRYWSCCNCSSQRV